jgi:D-mycarose 3-C-methyltransferase
MFANDDGIDTINEYFGANQARLISSLRGKPRVITATNVFAHINDLDDFLNGIYFWLGDNGVFVIEVPYLAELIKNVEFDTIYHEHLSYFAVRPLVALFKRWGMSIIEIEQIGVHGGTIRAYVVKGENKPSPSVEELIRQEIELGLDKVETYKDFAKKVKQIRSKLVSMLKGLKRDGAGIVGYGASAKGNILLNYCKIGADIIDYIADTTPYKQGLFTPGMRIPVVDFYEFYASSPDYTLLLIWNYAESILKKERDYIKSGGKFIVPIPMPYILE